MTDSVGRRRRINAFARALLLIAFFLPLVGGTLPARSIRGYPVKAVGYVRDEATGKPIAGALLTATAGSVRRETRTDESGWYRLVVPSLGSGDEPPEAWADGYAVNVQASGYLSGDSHIYQPVPSRRPVALWPVQLTPVAAHVTVTAADERGRPVEISGGWLLMDSNRLPRAVSTSGEGIPVEAGRVHSFVWTTDGRLGNTSITIPPGPAKAVSVEVVVVPGRPITGFVRDAGGRPLPGATVWAHRPNSSPHARYMSLMRNFLQGRPLALDHPPAVTAADGSFRLILPPQGEVALIPVLRHHFVPPDLSWSTPVKLDSGRVDLVLVHYAQMRIRILNRDGSPAAGLQLGSPHGSPGIPDEVSTDESGICELVASKMRPTSEAYTLWRDGRVVGGVVVPNQWWSAGDELVTCHVAPKEILDLVVVDAVTGAPLPDVAVTGCGVLTDEQGRCTAETYVTEHHGRLPWPALHCAGYEDFELGPDYSPEETDVIRLVPMATIRVRFVSEDGPCSGLWVWEGMGWTGEDGRAAGHLEPGFDLTHLKIERPDGFRQTIEVHRPWQPRMLLEWLGIIDSSQVAPGETIDLGTYRLETLPR